MRNRNLVRTVAIVTSISVFAKLIGFIRDIIIAQSFGVTSNTDAFYLSQSMPGIIFPAVCASLSTAFISIYAKKQTVRDRNIFAKESFINSIIIASVLSLLSILILPSIIRIIARGFDENTIQLAILLSTITMSSFTLIMIQYSLSAILNSNKKFYLVQLSGIIYNIAIIIPMFFSNIITNVIQLTIIVVIAHLFQSIILLIYSFKYIKTPERITLFNDNFRVLIRLALPILVGNSVIQIQSIVDKSIATGLTTGSLSSLNYGSTLFNLVISVIIISLSTVLFPILSDHKFQENKIGFNSLIKNTSDLASLILFPIMIIMFINSIDIVRIVYQRGAFSAEDTIVTSYVLKLLSVSLFFVSLREILVRVFYSKNDTKTPMINGIFAVFINVILSIFLSRIYGLNGIVIATTISTILSSVIIIILAKIKLGVIPTNFSAFTISKILMIFLIVFLFSFYFKISSLPTFFNLVANSLVTLVMYFILLIMFKIDIKALIMFMKKRS